MAGLLLNHLRRLRHSLAQDPALQEALRTALTTGRCPTEESFYRLRSAGLLVGATPEDARLRCRLYESYLARHLL